MKTPGYWDRYRDVLSEGPLGWLGRPEGVGSMFGIVVMCLTMGNGEMNESTILVSSCAALAMLVGMIVIVMRWFETGLTEKGRNSGPMVNVVMTATAVTIAVLFSAFAWSHAMLVALQAAWAV